MKKLSLFLIAVILFSCGEHEDVIYDPYNSETFASFADGSETVLDVFFPNNASVDVNIALSTLSTSDRTVQLSIDEEESTAGNGQYTIGDLSVTIPAGEFFGTIAVTGISENLSVGSSVNIIFNIESVSDGGSVSSQSHSVKITQVCTVDSPFTGTYTLTTVSTGINSSPVFDNGTVTISEGGSSTSREFDTNVYSDLLGSTGPDFTLKFSLVCGDVIIDSGQLTGVTCGGSEILIGPATLTGSYQNLDDSSFTLIINDDEAGTCGGPIPAEFLLEKIN